MKNLISIFFILAALLPYCALLYKKVSIQIRLLFASLFEILIFLIIFFIIYYVGDLGIIGYDGLFYEVIVVLLLFLNFFIIIVTSIIKKWKKK